MRTFQVALAALAFCAVPVLAQDQPPQQPQSDATLNQVVDKIVARENAEMNTIRQYSPLVETYIQDTKKDKEEGWIPNGDRYFLGRAELAKGVELESLTQTNASGHHLLTSLNNMFNFGVEFLPRGFLQMIYLDTSGLNKQDYHFEYARREFLGEVRTLAFDVTPTNSKARGRFIGRIWVEDKNYTIVRFNGAYTGSSHSNLYFHFDSWRVNAGPNLWLPAFIYSEEKDMRYALGKTLSFKAQTRIWGYDLGHNQQEQELSKILVEGNAPINDQSQQNNDVTPLQATRNWDREAEDNVVDRLQRMGLIAPEGDVDKALDTIINNLEIGSNLDIEPEVRCRILMTSTIESFNLGHTIVMSRGLIDVLPDEASFATMLAEELAHIALGHEMDTQYAFFDRLLLFDEKQTFKHFDFSRTKEEDDAASAKAAEILQKSTYKDQLKIPEMFLAELQTRAKEVPNLISPKLGNAILAKPPVVADTADKPTATEIVALPLGGRVKLDPWNDKLDLLKSKPVGMITEREKMPFEVTPFMPYLTRENTGIPQTAVTADSKQNTDKPQPPQQQ
jgi:hypothetical protein